jgi:tetratricopeptide (TPR) repeat protein
MPDSGETGPLDHGANATVSDVAPVRRSHMLERGAIVGRYVVLEAVGSGGMSTVYAAYDPELDRKVALKVVGSSAGATSLHDRERLRLLREAQAMARLSHPNVVAVYDAGSLGERVFLAMHFVDGETLGDWLRRPRPWREIVEFFGYAGRGVAAAHSAGLVHRDFKPDNVLVERDGRVRVTDFGLARPTDGPRSVEIVPEDSSVAASTSGTMLERPVTIAGAVLGTPAYMSPEQHLAQPVDARTDQFSFCVALWEALAGERPFAGATVGELAYAVTRGEMRPFPRESAVPMHVRTALLRGLARQPDDRFPSMNDLLAALEPPVRARKAGLLVGGAALVAAAIVIPWVGDREPVVDPCAASRRGLDDVWTADARNELRDGIVVAGGLRPELGDRVLTALDRFAEQWRSSAIDACTAHHIEARQSAEAFDARMACLGRRRSELDEVRRRIATSGPTRIEAAALAAFELVRPSHCDDAQRLLLDHRAPDDPAGRERAEEIWSRLDALRSSGEVDDARLAATLAAVVDAEATGWPALLARAQAFAAAMHEARGEHAAAESFLRKAARTAATANEDGQKLVTLGELAYNLAYLQNRLPEAVEIGFFLELELAGGRAEGDPRVPGIWTALGSVYQAANDPVRARAAYVESLLQLDRGGMDNPLRRAVATNNLGTIALAQGDPREAAGFFHDALELTLLAYGEGHIRLSDNHVNLCDAHMLAGELGRARPHCEAALALVDGPKVRDLAATARALIALTTLELITGDLEATRRWLDRAGPVTVEAFGAGSFADFVVALVEVYVEARAGELEQATRRLADAEQRFGALVETLPVAKATVLGLRGSIAIDRAAFDEAVAACDAAVVALEGAVGDLHPQRVEPLGCRAQALVALGRSDEATASLEQVVAIGQKHGGDPYWLARSEMSLARIVATKDRARADVLVSAARDHFAEAPRRSSALAAELAAWPEAEP